MCNRDTFISKFIQNYSEFNSWNQPRCLSTDLSVKKMWSHLCIHMHVHTYKHTTLNHLYRRINFLFLLKWVVKLEIILLNESIQILKKDIYYVFSLTWGIWSIYCIHDMEVEVRLFRRKKGIRGKEEEKQEMVMGRKINKAHDIHPWKCHDKTHCLM